MCSTPEPIMEFTETCARCRKPIEAAAYPARCEDCLQILERMVDAEAKLQVGIVMAYLYREAVA